MDFVFISCFRPFWPTWGLACPARSFRLWSWGSSKYGLTSSEAAYRSWVFCRIQAFASQAAFPDGDSLVRVGDPVVGCVEPTNRKPKSAQLTARPKTTPEFWRLSTPASFPIRFELDHNAIYCLPHLSAEGFAYTWPPKSNFLLLDSSLRTPTIAADASKREPSRSPSRRGRDTKKSPPICHGERTAPSSASANPATADEFVFLGNSFFLKDG